MFLGHFEKIGINKETCLCCKIKCNTRNRFMAKHGFIEKAPKLRRKLRYELKRFCGCRIVRYLRS